MYFSKRHIIPHPSILWHTIASLFTTIQLRWDCSQLMPHNPIVFLTRYRSYGLGDVDCIDSSAAATGLIVFELFKHAGWRITEKIAEALFVALATDTGWFQFSNANSRVYRACAELIDAGIKPSQIYDHLYLNYTHSRFKLMAKMLGTLGLHFDERFATQHILQQDFLRTGTTSADTENLINECHRIGTVEASALFIETEDGRIRCSLRSRGAVDVSIIAKKFGGGGHKAASGTFLPGHIENAKQLILEEMAAEFGEAAGRGE